MLLQDRLANLLESLETIENEYNMETQDNEEYEQKLSDKLDEIECCIEKMEEILND